MSITRGTRWHAVRVGTLAEQQYLTDDLRNAYGSLLFNANLVAWAPAGVAAFLCLPDFIGKPILIDPITHAFQHDPSLLLRSNESDGDDEDEEGDTGVQLKASFQKLVDAYGAPIQGKAGREACVPETFADSGLSLDFTRNVLAFQKSKVREEVKETDAYDFLAFAHEGELSLAEPDAIIAPYFYMSPTTYTDWLAVNTAFVRHARADAANFDVAAQIVLDKDLLVDQEAIQAIATGYRDAEADVFFLWIDEFSEHAAGKQALEGLVSLVTKLRGDSDRPVANLYGGFFSILLSHPDVRVLDGVCHGPQYGEDRAVVPVGGGLPTARFYLPSAHQRFRYKDVLAVLRKNGWLDSAEAYYQNVCDCPQCHELVGLLGPSAGFAKYGASKSVTFVRQGQTVSMAIPIQETKVLATRHYMYCKRGEFELLNTASVPQILTDLDRIKGVLAPTLGLDAVGYLKLWSDVVRPLVK
jgi:hypothetical protein